ncbi:MAG: 30S ribosomal protein S1, partial [Terriglobales bacterium]
EGIQAQCRIPREGSEGGAKKEAATSAASPSKPDLSSLGSMLQARWKSGAAASETKPEGLRTGQVREFRIAKVDAAAKKVELELE